jgi:tRNA uridine 5-carbamoylmethylation protein Kti12
METLKIINFITLCGIAGSGKTTLSKRLTDTYNAKLYSYDEILSKNNLTSYEVRAQILSSITCDLQAGFNVILDDLNILANSRIEVLDTIKDCKCNKILIVLNTPLSECLHRNKNRVKRLPDWVIEHMYRKYQIPTLDEGWDEILYC